MIIGITGGIGSGKSSACDFLKTMGYPVVDADKISRELTADGGSLVAVLAENFGSGILSAPGVLNRKALADFCFGDEEKTAKLNEITHGAIQEELIRQINSILEKNPQSLVFADVPLLFEAGWQNITDKTILVTADENIRIERVMKRDGISASDVKKRMERQMPEAQKAQLADYVIDNSGDIRSLNVQLIQLLNNMV